MKKIYVHIALKEIPNFETIINNRPLELLERVLKLIHGPTNDQYPLFVLAKNMTNTLKLY